VDKNWSRKKINMIAWIALSVIALIAIVFGNIAIIFKK
jgi:hypothetical protein